MHAACFAYLILPDHPNNILVNSTSYDAPHYAVFSSLLPLPPSQVQIASSASYSQHLHTMFLS
jgi:hypothetical protein